MELQTWWHFILWLWIDQPFNAQWLLYIPPAATLKSYALSHTDYVFFIILNINSDRFIKEH